jgi:hypothetical protein
MMTDRYDTQARAVGALSPATGPRPTGGPRRARQLPPSPLAHLGPKQWGAALSLIRQEPFSASLLDYPAENAGRLDEELALFSCV